MIFLGGLEGVDGADRFFFLALAESFFELCFEGVFFLPEPPYNFRQAPTSSTLETPFANYEYTTATSETLPNSRSLTGFTFLNLRNVPLLRTKTAMVHSAQDIQAHRAKAASGPPTTIPTV